MSTNERRSGRTHAAWWRRTWVKWTAAALAVCFVGCLITAEYVLHHLAPIVKKRVVETLSARFKVPVELDELQISLLRGVEVQGRGLRIPYSVPQGVPARVPSGTLEPLISVNSFTFRTTLRGLLHVPTRIAVVRLDGMEIDLPPSHELKKSLNLKPQHKEPKFDFLAADILATNVKLVIEKNDPQKEPMVFEIGRLDLWGAGEDSAMKYDAELVNPKPVGNIHAIGHFGPWDAEQPRQTPLDGKYNFSHADFNSIKGLGGIMSSTGHFTGVLDHITIDGSTEMPNFSLDISNHPMPLTTKFHAYVDGTNGDTTLDPVIGMLRNTEIIARGVVKNVKGKGHDISLDAVLPNARMEDVLELAVKTAPPLMRGALWAKVHIHVPPGKERVSQKLELSGGVMKIQNVVFQKSKWQDKIDGLSMRAQGKPKDAKEAGKDKVAEVDSTMGLDFKVEHGSIDVDNLLYQIPGAKVSMNGVYSMDGKVFEFRGHVRTDAKASQMVTGWKAILLKPVDPFLKKNGAGMELPISISGIGSDMKFGLAMHGSADESSQQIEQDLKSKPSDADTNNKKKPGKGDSR